MHSHKFDDEFERIEKMLRKKLTQILILIIPFKNNLQIQLQLPCKNEPFRDENR